MQDGCLMRPSGLAQSIQRGESRFRVDRRRHRAMVLAIQRRNLVWLGDQLGGRIVERRPLGWAVGMRGRGGGSRQRGREVHNAAVNGAVPATGVEMPASARYMGTWRDRTK
jgi:hypothetical protein